MGLTHLTVTVRNLADPVRTYSALFLVDSGAYDSLIPAEGAEALGVGPAGYAECELTDGTPKKLPFAVCQIEFSATPGAGSSRLSRRARGAPPAAWPVTAQLHNEQTGVCLEGVYDSADVIKNDSGQCKRRSRIVSSWRSLDRV